MIFSNKTFLVTGGASGLGAAAAASIAKQGGNLVLLDVNKEAVEAAAQQYGNNAVATVADVASEEEVLTSITKAKETFGRIDGLINAAGIAPGEKVVGKKGPHSLENFERALRINLLGTFNTMRLVADVMTQQEPLENGERGVIINTASIAAYDGQMGQTAYAASKGGVVSLTLPAARDLAQHGIRVVTIAPGIFETPMMAAMPQAVKDSLGESVPFPSRLGFPSEYAQLVCHIFENQMLNGEVIRLDGALRMAAK